MLRAPHLAIFEGEQQGLAVLTKRLRLRPWHEFDIHIGPAQQRANKVSPNN
jgi:hypothetical protein